MTPEPWRHRCPEGHTGWSGRSSSQPENPPESRYYCNTCLQNGDDPHFDELVDMKDPSEKHVENPDVGAV